MRYYTDRRLLLINDHPPAPSVPSNATSSSAAAAYADGDPAGYRLDSSSMAVTVLVILAALLFLGFFSVYARRFLSAATHPGDRPPPRGTRPGPPPYALRFGLSSSSFAPAPPPDPAAIRGLPLLSYGSGAGKGQAAACVVCLSEFAEKEIVKAIPACGHVFHPDCIDAWLLRHGSCPLCRSTELFADLSSGSDAEEHRPAGGDRGRYRDSTRAMEENAGEAEEREGGVGKDLLSRRSTGRSSDRWGCSRAQTATTPMRRSHSV